MAAVAELTDAINQQKLGEFHDILWRIRALEAGSAAIPVLIAGLERSDEETRRRVTSALGRIYPTNDEAISTLIGLLSHNDEDYRFEVVLAIAQCGSAAVAPLREALKADDPHVRNGAAHALYHIGIEYAELPGREIAPDLAAALQDDDTSVRLRAAATLEQMGPNADSAVGSLIESLGDENQGVRTAAANALGTIGPRAAAAIPELRRMILDDDSPIWIHNVLGGIGPPAIDVLVELLQHEDATIRSDAAMALARIGPVARGARPKLIAQFKDDDPRAAADAVVALYVIDGQIGEGLPVLIDRVDESPSEVSWAVAQIGPAAKDLVPRLIQVARKSDDQDVRRSVVTAFRYLGPAAKEAVPFLVEAMKAEDDRRIPGTGAALVAIGRSAAPALARLLSDPDPTCRQNAACYLSRMGRKAKQAIPALCEAVDDEDEDVRVDALSALRHITSSEIGSRSTTAMLSAVRQDKLLRDALTVIVRDHGTDVSNGIENAINEMSTAAIAASVEQLTSSDDQSRKLAAMSLRDLEPNDNDAITALRGRLEDESIVVRIEVGAALLNSDDQDRAAISVLANALTHPDNWIRRRAAFLSGEIGSAAKALVPSLQKSFSDIDPKVRVAAAEAVTRIDPDNHTGIRCLISLLETKTRYVYQLMAIEALARFPSRANSAVPVLQRLLIAVHSDRLTGEAADVLHQIRDAR